MREYLKKIQDGEAEKVIASLMKMKKDICELNSDGGLRIYNNKMVCDMLNISEKLLLRYRYDGLLTYSRDGDKYWYTQDDIEKFLDKTHEVSIKMQHYF